MFWRSIASSAHLRGPTMDQAVSWICCRHAASLLDVMGRTDQRLIVGFTAEGLPRRSIELPGDRISVFGREVATES